VLICVGAMRVGEATLPSAAASGCRSGNRCAPPRRRAGCFLVRLAEKLGVDVVSLMGMTEITCPTRKSRPCNFDRDRPSCPSNHSNADTMNRIWSQSERKFLEESFCRSCSLPLLLPEPFPSQRTGPERILQKEDLRRRSSRIDLRFWRLWTSGFLRLNLES